MSSFSVSGLSSGIDSDAMVTQLMALERLPVNKMQANISKMNQQTTAWTKLEALAKSVAGKAQELATASRLYAPTTTSSNTGAVTVTGNAAEGTSFEFTVSSLARAGQSAVTGFTDASQVIGAGDVTVTTAAGAKTVTLGAGATVADLVAAVNSTGLATGSVLNTGDSTLGTEALFTSAGTGTAAEATITLSGFAQAYATAPVRAASDATLVMGSQTITRPTNTISDLVPGVTLTLKATTTADVTVASARNDDEVAAKVKGFVTSINELLADIKTFTKTDPEGSDGVLSGNAQLRSLNVNLMRSITSSYGDGAISIMSQVGIRIERDGTLSFNEAAFKTALADDPAGVADVLSRNATASSTSVGFSSSSATTVSGTYDVVVTAAATRAELATSVFATLASDTDFTVTVGDKTKTFTAVAGTAAEDVAKAFDAFFTKEGFALNASWENDTVVVRSDLYGSASSFTLSSSMGSGTATGTDVAGTINGAAAAGKGQTLTSSGSASQGLALTIRSTPGDVAAAGGNLALGSVSFNEGIGGVLTSLFNETRDAGGMFPSALESIDRAKRATQEDIESYERRLEMRESNMRAKFAALEVAMARIKSNTPDFASLSTDIYSGRN